MASSPKSFFLKKQHWLHARLLVLIRACDWHISCYSELLVVSKRRKENSVSGTPTGNGKLTEVSGTPSFCRLSFDETKEAYRRIILEAANRNVEELFEEHEAKYMQLIQLEKEVDEFVDQLEKDGIPVEDLKNYDNVYEPIAYEEIIQREIDEYWEMYETFLEDVAYNKTSFSDVSDSTLNLMMRKYERLDEDTIRWTLYEWLPVKQKMDNACKFYDFSLYLLNANSDAIFEDDYRKLAKAAKDYKDLDEDRRENAINKILVRMRRLKSSWHLSDREALMKCEAEFREAKERKILEIVTMWKMRCSVEEERRA